MRFDFKITHVPGKDLIIADTLSRAPASISTKDDQLLQSEADVYVQAAMLALPATEKRLNEIREKQKEDQVCDQVMRYCKSGQLLSESFTQLQLNYRFRRGYFCVGVDWSYPQL